MTWKSELLLTNRMGRIFWAGLERGSTTATTSNAGALSSAGTCIILEVVSDGSMLKSLRDLSLLVQPSVPRTCETMSLDLEGSE